MKYCVNCKHHAPKLGYVGYICERPTGYTSPVDGEHVTHYLECYLQRNRSYKKEKVEDICGSEARYYEDRREMNDLRKTFGVDK